MIVTRDIINKNILFKDYTKKDDDLVCSTYTYTDLSLSIDAVKNYLEKNYVIESGQSMLIGVRIASRMQLALVFACLELGIALTIVDYDRKDDFIDYNYVDPKTRLLLPITYHVVNNEGHTKFKIFQKVCDNTIILDNVVLDDFTPNSNIYATDSTLMMRCTSSGTTGTPKIIEHTHEFLYSLIQRNATQFSGTAGYIFNLNHGSSPAVYFFPTLASHNTTECINFNWNILNDILSTVQIDNLLIPYSHQIQSLLSHKPNNNNNIILYTLSTIKTEWLSHLKQNKIKDIVSIFGSNETSGPVFLNKLSTIGFHESKFFRVDDFYGIELNEQNEIIVTLPIYNKKIKTNDKFRYTNNFYYHLGRSDLLRINGREIDLYEYDKMLQKTCDGNLIYDTVENKIYLALWKDENVGSIVETMNTFLLDKSDGAHSINKFAVLKYENFLTGIKLDQELLRDYFRNYIKSILQ